MWHVIDSLENTASHNMQKDTELLDQLNPDSPPVFHFYDWTFPSLTYGHFIDPDLYLKMDELHKEGWDSARRPTGGGIIFHKWDFTFSAIVPSSLPFFSKNTLDNYQFIHEIVKKAVKDFLGLDSYLIKEDFDLSHPDAKSFCMARPTKYDLMLEGKKIAGAAQRQTKKGYLHQGSISLSSPDLSLLKKIIRPQKEIIDSMLSYSFPLLGKTSSRKELKQAKLRLKQLLVNYAEETTERYLSDKG
ncbi:MAG: lipoyl protein ligase domain-containing protein [Rhabdochlamydiaceae bacterium]